MQIRPQTILDCWVCLRDREVQTLRSSGCWPAWDRDILQLCLMPQEQKCDLCGLFVQTRALYAPFESDLRSSSSDVYYHEMPGGQYTNLKFQVTALSVLNGLACATEAGRSVCVAPWWHYVCKPPRLAACKAQSFIVACRQWSIEAGSCPCGVHAPA